MAFSSSRTRRVIIELQPFQFMTEEQTKAFLIVVRAALLSLAAGMNAFALCFNSALIGISKHIERQYNLRERGNHVVVKRTSAIREVS